MQDSYYSTELGSIYQGDCLEVMNGIEDNSVDMVLCDLPYGITKCKWDTVIPFEPLWEQYNRVVKKNGAIVLFGTEPFSSTLRASNIKNYKYDWVWDKVKGVGYFNAKRQPMRNHELISVFYRKQPTYNPQMTSGHALKKSKKKKESNTEVYGKNSRDHEYCSTKRYPKSIQIFSTDTQRYSFHPTQKPLALIEYLIKTYSNEGDLVLDNTAGSFTTCLGAENLNRRWIGIEKEEKYCKIGRARLSNHQKLELSSRNC